jgi:hypothetical protein
VTVADQIGGPAGQSLALAAKTAFVDGLHTTSVVAAGIAALGALIAFVYLPARALDDDLDELDLDRLDDDDLDDDDLDEELRRLMSVGS